MIRLSVRDRDIVQTVRIEADKAFVGRSTSNAIVLRDAAASRKHCMLRVRQGAVEILDLNSRNGLKVNGQVEHRAMLRPGDRIVIGDAELKVEEIEGDRPALEAFGGYLDDESHLYTIKDVPPPPESSERTTGEVDTLAEGPGGNGDPAAETKPARRTGRSFADELYRNLKRMPAWGLSIGVHLALWFLILQIPWATPRGEEDVSGVLAGSEEGWSPLEDKVPEMPEGLPEEAPDIEEESPPPETVDDMPSEVLEEAAEDEPTLPPLIGPHDDAFHMKVRGLGSKSKVQLGPNQSFGSGEAGDVNRRVSGFVMDSLGGAQGRLARLLRKRPQNETIVVRGTYDRVETVLDMFRVPHTRVELRELRDLDLKGVKTIFVNCSNEGFPDDIVKKVAAFVKEGGYLFSTDWALENVIEKAFPRTIVAPRKQGQITGTPDTVVPVQGRLKHHHLLEGTGLEREEAEWWLEDSSYPIKVLRTDAVEVLVSSKELRRRFGTGAVAVTFPWGQGRVLHVMGHYYQKKGNLRGAFAMQKVITNFLIAAIRRR